MTMWRRAGARESSSSCVRSRYTCSSSKNKRPDAQHQGRRGGGTTRGAGRHAEVALGMGRRRVAGARRKLRRRGVGRSRPYRRGHRRANARGRRGRSGPGQHPVVFAFSSSRAGCPGGRHVTAGWDDVLLILPYVLLSVVAIYLHRRLLDALTLGEDEVTSLGIPVRRVRLIVVVAATLGTAAVVAVGGTIAFVGIIVPHTIRLLVGRSYRVVIPLSVLFGAAFLVLADAAARTVVAPAELPIGVITAFLGAPFFIAVMRSTRAAAL